MRPWWDHSVEWSVGSQVRSPWRPARSRRDEEMLESPCLSCLDVSVRACVATPGFLAFPTLLTCKYLKLTL